MNMNDFESVAFRSAKCSLSRSEGRLSGAVRLGLLGLAILLCTACIAEAQQRNGKPQAKSNTGMTKAREAAAVAFVREHHPELEQLLIQLKESEPKQYDQAVRDLFRTSERLASILERDPPRHELELKLWQQRSRVQLLSATMTMTPQDERLRQRLKRALLDESDARRKLLSLDLERTTKKMERLKSQMELLEKNAEKSAERQINGLLKPPTKDEPVQNTTAKPVQ